MIKFEKTEVLGWRHALRGMRNPLNSWSKADSCFCEFDPACEGNCNVYMGDNDYKLAKNLTKAGTDHRKFLRMITVYVDITAPLYW